MAWSTPTVLASVSIRFRGSVDARNGIVRVPPVVPGELSPDERQGRPVAGGQATRGCRHPGEGPGASPV
ncbi:MAG: hypothetical protein OEX97_14205, partial [Acidimicrobiia bacterium]|nr:hypothetical protein [Acidimicrobiia bacterium]